jgi:serine/threonine protein kinase
MNTADPLIGQQIDNYLIQQALGRGGMARVYKGMDTNLKRPVAIKVIEEGYRANATYAQRFEREAQSVANLKHPHIVTVFHFGKHDGLYYLVMEYIDGADLDALLSNYERNGELMPHHDVIRILSAIAGALDDAHAQGVIHRDVKPSNIMLEKNGRPVLTDFGLALRQSEGTRGDTFGSPHYISPEQARNSANAVPQSDIYSLGVIAYELLTGILPFDDPSATSLAMQHILQAVPSPRLFNRELSEQVEQVLVRVLAKLPEERYQSGAEFIDALREALELLKVNPTKVSTAELPPMPPGLEPPPPRRLSMQTAVDKLQQEMNMVQARGQSLTRNPTQPPGTPALALPARTTVRRSPFIFVLPIVGIVGILIAIGATLSIVTRGNVTPTAVANIPTETLRVTATLQVTTQQVTTQQAAAAAPTDAATPTLTPEPPILMPTDLPPPTVQIATSTPVPTETPIPATATPIAAAFQTSAPAILPTTPVPDTSIPPTIPPTTAPTIAPTIAPTVLYPEGKRFVLAWDAQTFFAVNQSGARIGSTSFSFERLLSDGGAGQTFSGGRWAGFYPWSENGKCLVVRMRGTSAALPRDLCQFGYNAEATAVSGELFWTPLENSTQFRVLWNNQEIARCQIDLGRCEIRIP